MFGNPWSNPNTATFAEALMQFGILTVYFKVMYDICFFVLFFPRRCHLLEFWPSSPRCLAGSSVAPLIDLCPSSLPIISPSPAPWTRSAPRCLFLSHRHCMLGLDQTWCSLEASLAQCHQHCRVAHRAGVAGPSRRAVYEREGKSWERINSVWYEVSRWMPVVDCLIRVFFVVVVWFVFFILFFLCGNENVEGPPGQI